VAVVVDAGPEPDAKEVEDIVKRGFVAQRMNRFAPVPHLQAELSDALVRAGYRVSPADAAEVVIQVVPTRWVFQMDPAKAFIGGDGRLDVKIDVREARAGPEVPALFKESYWATQSVGVAGEEAALQRTARTVARMLLAETRPSRVSARVELDDSDPAVRTGIALCRQNQFRAAYEAFSQAVSANPESAPALYNFGVMAEIQGHYDLAESSIRRATQLSPRAIYFTALERVHKARADAEAIDRARAPTP
jgi:tetratricopeptide (TPR) repeat protein